MRKHILIIGAIITIPTYNAAALTLQPVDPILPEVDCVAKCATNEFICPSFSYAGCDETECKLCKSSTATSIYGVTTTTNKYYDVACNQSNCQATCSCITRSTTYSCSSGYYGTATSANAGCTKCPANATCPGGNGSTFTCNTGYTKTGNTCTQMSCPAGQYLSSDTCKDCPSPGTSDAGATAITQCYVTGGSDDTGTYIYDPKCYYQRFVIVNPDLEL